MGARNISQGPRLRPAASRVSDFRKRKPRISLAEVRQTAATRLVARLTSPKPFRKVLEPAPELTLKARVTSLRHCCKSAPDKVLRQIAQNKGHSLLTALNHAKRSAQSSRRSTKKGSKPRPSDTFRSMKVVSMGASARKGMPAQVELNAMLAEAAEAEEEQSAFLSEQEADGPKGPGTDSQDLFALKCCACWRGDSESSLVLCNLAKQRLKFAKQNSRSWAEAPLAQRRRQGMRAMTRAEYAAMKLREFMSDIEPHVFCAGCLRKYLMGTSVHMGELSKMFCPGCTEMLRGSAQAASASGDADADMVGLGLDGIRDQSWGTLMQPIDVSSLAQILGPLDLLWLCDVAFDVARPRKLTRGLTEILQSQGARYCPFCGHVGMHGGGCNAVLCERCGLVFNWDKAKMVRRR